MRFLFATLGSTGDVYPFLALGHALRRAGHRVTLLASPRHAADAALAQIDFAPVPANGPEPDLNALVARMLEKSSRLEQLEILYEGLAPVFGPLLDETKSRLPDHDVLVTSYLFPFLKNAARAARRPCAALVFCPNNLPNSRTGPEDAPAAPAWAPKVFRQFHHRLAWKVGEKMLDQIVQRHAGAALQSRGLGKFHGFLRDPADRALVAVSQVLFPPPGPLPENYLYTGFLRWQPPADERAAADLAAVRALEQTGAPLPILTLGSMAPAAAREIFARLLAAWPRGAPLVVQSGWAGWRGDPSRPEVLVIGAVPHDQLFAHATIVIHHGGSGTTASALHAGRPQIIIPHLGDQFYWARAMQALGVAKVLSRTTWPESLCETLEGILRDVAVVRRVTDCATRVRAEDGVAQAVFALEKMAKAK
jgi:vancomycin aglycone glucosyltransferase